MKYFAYGANMALSSMLGRCPNATPLQKFTLRGWRLDFGHHATIVRDPDAVCDGALWEITDMCERSLDMFEGYPTYYEKLHLEQDGLQFMVYEMNDLDTSAYPSASYIDCLREGYHDWKLDHRLLDTALHYAPAI
jgi:gamma-glutamylcyclotransferase (GGCT)/AIG2-like uncharacterized protein YtfP